MNTKQSKIFLTLASLCFLTAIQYAFPGPASAKGFWGKLGSAMKDLDITDRRSGIRRVLREADFTSPSSALCRGIKTGGATVAAESVATAYGAPGAGTAAISILTGTCTKPNSVNKIEIAQDLSKAIEAEWSARVKIRQLEIEGKVEEAKAVQNALIKIEKARQSGQTKRLEIYMNALVKINQARTDAEIEKANIELRAVIVQEETEKEITRLQEEGKNIRAGILSDTLKSLEEAKQKGWTRRVELETNALIKMNAADNERQLREAKLEATTERLKIIEVGLQEGSQVIIALFDLKKEKIRAKKEIRIAEIELETVLAQTPTQPPRQNSAEKVLVSWGWQRVSCSPQSVFISGITTETVCVDPRPNLRAGQYQYDVATNQLSRIISKPTQTSVEKLLNTWGWPRVNCSPEVVFISGMAADMICVNPRPGLRAGQYQYNAEFNRLSRISSKRR